MSSGSTSQEGIGAPHRRSVGGVQEDMKEAKEAVRTAEEGVVAQRQAGERERERGGGDDAPWERFIAGLGFRMSVAITKLHIGRSL